MSLGHAEAMIVLVVSSTIQIGGLFVLGCPLDGSRTMVAGSQRLTRAVTALVVQDSDTIRSLRR